MNLTPDRPVLFIKSSNPPKNNTCNVTRTFGK